MSCHNEHQFSRRILVTGGAGFIGSHLVLLLVKKYKQYLIVNIDKLDYCASQRHLISIENEENYKFCHGDICDVNMVKELMHKEEITDVIHCAAQSHVDLSFTSSLEFTINNTYGTHVLVEAARQHGVTTFLHISTDEVYGGASEQSLSECSPMHPTNPYAASKVGAEAIVQSYCNAYDFPAIIARPNNVYGPHQFPEKVLPKFISLLERDRKCCVYGSGNYVRSFLFVEDVVKAFDILLHHGKKGEAYNISGEYQTSILDLAKALIKQMKPQHEECEYLDYVTDRQLNDQMYPINDDKIRSLGWRPLTCWTEGLRRTVEWYRTPGNFLSWPGSEDALVAHSHHLLQPSQLPWKPQENTALS